MHDDHELQASPTLELTESHFEAGNQPGHADSRQLTRVGLGGPAVMVPVGQTEEMMESGEDQSLMQEFCEMGCDQYALDLMFARTTL